MTFGQVGGAAGQSHQPSVTRPTASTCERIYKSGGPITNFFLIPLVIEDISPREESSGCFMK